MALEHLDDVPDDTVLDAPLTVGHMRVIARMINISEWLLTPEQLDVLTDFGYGVLKATEKLAPEAVSESLKEEGLESVDQAYELDQQEITARKRSEQAPLN